MIKMKISNISPFAGGTICAGALLLASASAPAQNIFVGNYNQILEFSSEGVQTTFAGGLNYARSLAFLGITPS
jgi:hypothetical protein